MPRRFFHRHQADVCLLCWLKAGIGSAAAFAMTAMVGDLTGASFMFAPMAASAVLIYGVPQSPLAQPAHVVFGHVVAAILAIAADHFLPASPWMLAGTIGTVIAVLGLLRLTHPPAAATAMVVLLTHPNWGFILSPVLTGAVTLVTIAVITHWLPPRNVTYPLHPPGQG